MSEDLKDLRSYAWDYFHFHASQRLTTFNFYIIMVALIINGYIEAVNADNPRPEIGIILGLLMVFLSVIFNKLEFRNKQLVKNGENALKYLDSQLKLKDPEAEVVKIFTTDAKIEQEQAQQNERFYGFKHWRYSQCFNAIYLTFRILGYGLVIYTVFLFR